MRRQNRGCGRDESCQKSCLQSKAFACLLESAGDVVLVADVLLFPGSELGFLRCDQSPLIRVELVGVSGQRRQPGLEDQAEQVIWIVSENAIRLCFREW